MVKVVMNHSKFIVLVYRSFFLGSYVMSKSLVPRDDRVGIKR